MWVVLRRASIRHLVVALLIVGGVASSTQLVQAADVVRGSESLDWEAFNSKKSLQRLHDPVIVRTELLASLPDHRTSTYRLESDP
jgi:hypothetical protein